MSNIKGGCRVIHLDSHISPKDVIQLVYGYQVTKTVGGKVYQANNESLEEAILTVQDRIAANRSKVSEEGSMSILSLLANK